MGAGRDCSHTTDRPSVNQRPVGGRESSRRWLRWLLGAALVMAALNLRPAIAGLGPLLQEVREGIGMSGTVAGLLTSLPMLCFAAFGGLLPRLGRRFDPTTVVLAGLGAITLGLALRTVVGDTASFLAASVLALAGIAVGNVLMPVIVKAWFPRRVGTMTGVYSMAMALGTAGPAALAVPAAQALGDGSWRVGLGVWAVLAAAALPLWAVVRRVHGGPPGRPSDGDRGAGGTPASAGTGGAPSRPLRVSRSPAAWAVAFYFGLQSTAAYSVIGWLPQIFRDAGVSPTTAGALLACTMGLGVPLSFLVPAVAARLPQQGPLAAVLGVAGLLGYTGLWLAPAGGAWAWAVLLGVSNAAFPLALALLGMRARTGEGVARLSAFAQSVGYLISVPGPLLVGALHQYTGGWRTPLVLLTALMLAQIVMGWLAGRNRCVDDPS